MFCEYCSTELPEDGNECPSCLLYNAAVHAQRAAAKYIAEQRGATRAHLNEHGIYGWLNGQLGRVGSAQEAAPFAELTSRARAVKRAPDGKGAE